MEKNGERLMGPENKEHYPYVTRSLIRLFNEGRLTEVKNILVEPEYGYVCRIEYHDGSFRVTYGNDLGLNTGASADLAKDKGHTKFVLRSIGVDTPEGDEFLLPWWAEQIRPTQEKRGNTAIKTTDMASDYIHSSLSYPVYIKPVQGSKGGDVYRVDSDTELADIIDLYNEKKVRVAIVERAVSMPDYRLVVLDGQLISAYQRVPLTVTGNGKDTTEVLIARLQARYEQEGRDTRLDPRDPRILKHLGKQGLDLHFIPAEEQILTLVPISNLSTGGTSVDVRTAIHQRWVDLAAYIGKNFNLRLCGVDLACGDITSDEASYSVLEVNASPGLDHYAFSGDEQKRLVDDLYVQVLNTSIR